MTPFQHECMLRNLRYVGHMEPTHEPTPSSVKPTVLNGLELTCLKLIIHHLCSLWQSRLGLADWLLLLSILKYYLLGAKAFCEYLTLRITLISRCHYFLFPVHPRGNWEHKELSQSHRTKWQKLKNVARLQNQHSPMHALIHTDRSIHNMLPRCGWCAPLPQPWNSKGSAPCKWKQLWIYLCVPLNALWGI